MICANPKCGEEFDVVDGRGRRKYCGVRCRKSVDRQKWYTRHPERERQRAKEIRSRQLATNPDYYRKKNVVYNNRYKIQHQEKISNLKRERRNHLADSYIKDLLGLRWSTIPPQLIELKRIHITLKRLKHERHQNIASPV